MNLNNFESYVSSQVLQRGKKYFKDGLIDENSDNGLGYFTAVVQGSDTYTVEIELNETNTITHSYCDCPYDWGTTCKHIVAVLFDIRQIRKGEIINVDDFQRNKKENSTKIKAALNNMSDADLRKFLIEAIAEYPTLNNKLLSIYKKQKGLFTKPELDKLIDKIFKDARFDYYGYLSPLDIRKIQDQLNEYLKKATKFIQDAEISAALDIIETVLEHCITRHTNMTDKQTALEPVINQAINALEIILREAPSSKTDERIFSFCINSKMLFKFDVFFEQIAEMLMTLIETDYKEKQFFRWLENFKYYGNPKQQHYYKTKEAIYKFDIIAKRHNLTKAFAHANTKKHEIPEMLLKIIEIDIKGKNYENALYNTYLGINKTNKILQEKFHKKEEALNQILENQPDLICNAALKALSITRNIIFYDILKKHTKPKNWDKTLEDIIAETKKMKFGVEKLLTHIYIQEAMYYKLFDFVEEARNPVMKLIEFDQYLIKADIEHTGILYTVVIADLMEDSPDRDTYLEVTALLKRMQRLHLQENIDAIIEDFKINHKRRRALWEELRNAEIIEK